MGIYDKIFVVCSPYMGIYDKFSWYVALIWAFICPYMGIYFTLTWAFMANFRGMWPLHGHLGIYDNHFVVCGPYMGIYLCVALMWAFILGIAHKSVRVSTPYQQL